VKTVILITGYARAGKDTLAEGIQLGATKPVVRLNFADMLKQACDCYMQVLDLGGSGSSRTFRNEAFKVKHRDFLVAAGMFARSIDRDVFALAFTRQCNREASAFPEGDITVVCSDWRYMNELTIVKYILGDLGWNIVTVQIGTTDVHASNEEEGKSIGEIIRNTPIHVSYGFKPDSKPAIVSEGKSLARQLGL
jgi:hypothetical protein